MKISASIELVMQFSTYEAIAGKFREIEPEHLLMALLKFPELPVGEMEKLAPGASAKQIAEEINVVCKELDRRAIEGKKVRRELRAKMGKGNNPFSGGRIHRSSASRQLFDVAAKLADDAGNEVITAEYILEAIMISPTRVIEQVLGNAIGAKVHERKNTPFLDEYGIDLTKMAVNGELPAVSDRIAERKALIEALKQPGHRSVLLINDNKDVVESVVFATAQAICDEGSAKNLKGKRIIDIRASKPLGKWDKHIRILLGKIFAEAACAEDMILFIPSIELLAGTDAPNEWLNFLQKVLAKGSIQCICRATSAVYLNSIKRDSLWKRIADVMWIQDEIEEEVPREL